MTKINKNTYYMTPRWLLHSAISISRAKSGKYHLNKRDLKNGYYVTIELYNMSIKVPFSALFDVNDKIKPIKSLSFSSAILCPSAKRGLCQLDNQELTCYAKSGQLRASGSYVTKGAFKGGQQINSLMNSDLVTYCLKLMWDDLNLLSLFSAYINKNIPIVRFNLKDDIYLLSFLSARAFKTVFYGYSARDDLLTDLKGYDSLRGDNLFLNGSNCQYTNRFKATYDLKEWLTTSLICLGGCNKCKKCYTLRNKTIYCLVHGKNQDYDLNTWLNRVFLCDLFNSLNSDDSPLLVPSDLTIKKGLLESLNHQLKTKLNINLAFSDYWNLRAWLSSIHYDIQDNQETIRDVDFLKSLGVA